jgi:hypothetical protein
MLPMLIRIKALDQTGKAFKSVGKGLAGVTGAIFSMRTALVAVAGATGFGYLIKSNLNAIDALAKTASRIGTTTDALTRLHHAGELSGVSVDTLNMALQRMTRRVAEASRGTGEAQGALRQLGIEATSFNKLALDDKMKVLADSFGEVTDQNEQLRLAFKLFDSEGTAVVNMLKSGSGALQDMYEDAELLGLVMEQKSAKGVERANDALTRLFSISKGLFAQFSASLAPAIETLADHFTDLSIGVGDSYGGLKDFGQYLAKQFLLSIAGALDGISRFVNATISGFDVIMVAMDRLSGKKTARVLRDDIRQMTDALIEAEGATGVFDTIVSAGNRTRIGFDGIEFLSVDRLKMKIAEAEAELAKMGESVSSGYDNSGVVEFLINLANGIGKVGESADNAKGGGSGGVDELKNSFEKLNDVAIKSQDIMNSAVSKSFNGVTDAITAGITGAKKFSDAFKDMAKGVIDSLIKMMVQYMIVQPLFNAIGTSMGFNMNLSTGGGKATGGSVQAGKPYIVGEHGQEMFIPSSNGAIVSNKNMSGGAGVVINQTINLSTGVAQTVKAEVMNMMPQIASRTKQAVLDSRQRGGAYGRNLVGA